jgi:hypothetical protein
LTPIIRHGQVEQLRASLTQPRQSPSRGDVIVIVMRLDAKYALGGKNIRRGEDGFEGHGNSLGNYEFRIMKAGAFS